MPCTKRSVTFGHIYPLRWISEYVIKQFEGRNTQWFVLVRGIVRESWYANRNLQQPAISAIRNGCTVGRPIVDYCYGQTVSSPNLLAMQHLDFGIGQCSLRGINQRGVPIVADHEIRSRYASST